MKRSLKEYVVISLKGMAMGAADVVPGSFWWNNCVYLRNL
jgi:hypothetical protein